MFEALSRTVEDIEHQKKLPENKDGYFPVVCISSVINLPLILFKLAYTWAMQFIYEPLHTLIRRLVELDALLVMASGLHGGLETQHLPQAFSTQYSSIMRVGVVDVEGRFNGLPRAPSIGTVMAPAVNIECASPFSEPYVPKTGAYFAAPQVAGVAADLLSSDPTLRVPGEAAQKVADRIRELSYPRQKEGLPVVWNGQGIELQKFVKEPYTNK